MSEEKKVKLDLGCGRKKREGCIGIDIDPECGADITSTALEIPFNNNSVDEVYSNHLVEHFSPEEAQKFFDEVYRVLKPGGTSYMKVDRDWTKGRLIRKDPTHKYRFNSKEIRNIVKKFSKVDVKTRFYYVEDRFMQKIFVHLQK